MDATTTAPLRQRMLWGPCQRRRVVAQVTVPANRTDTSQAAAERVRPRTPGRHEVVLGLIRGQGHHGATNDELAVATGWPIQSVTPITHALAARPGRLIVDSGMRRPTRTGSPAKVFVAARTSS